MVSRYDVFSLPSGELCAVMGDVADAGLQAAVTMGRMRSALRAYALETPDPADVLHRLDSKMQHFEPGAIATVLYAVFEQDLEHVRISSAGHLPPVIAVPGHAAVLADITNDLLVGVSTTADRHVTTLRLSLGPSSASIRTGLVERPGRVLDDGLDALCQAVTAGPAEAVCSAVLQALVGREPCADDTTLLASRRQAP